MRIHFWFKIEALLLVIVGLSAQVVLAENLFRISDIPVGKSITVLPQTELQLELGSEVQLSSTDAPQTLKFDALVSKSVGNKKIKITVFDPAQTKVKVIEMSNGDHFLYSFRGLTTIRVVTQNLAKDKSQNIGLVGFLRLRSDRPITVGR